MNVIGRIIGWFRYRRQSGAWMAFCEEHFDEALKHITEKYKGFDVGYTDAFTPDQFKSDEDDQECLKLYVCDYPECEKYPYREIHWMKPLTAKDMKLSAYKPLK